MFKPNSVIFYSIRRWDNTTAASFTIRGSRIHTVSALIRPLAPAIQDDVTRDGIALARISRLITIANLLCSCVRVDLLATLRWSLSSSVRRHQSTYVQWRRRRRGAASLRRCCCGRGRRRCTTQAARAVPTTGGRSSRRACRTRSSCTSGSSASRLVSKHFIPARVLSCYIFYTHTHKSYSVLYSLTCTPACSFCTHIYKHLAYLTPHISISCLI